MTTGAWILAAVVAAAMPGASTDRRPSCPSRVHVCDCRPGRAQSSFGNGLPSGEPVSSLRRCRDGGDSTVATTGGGGFPRLAAIPRRMLSFEKPEFDHGNEGAVEAGQSRCLSETTSLSQRLVLCDRQSRRGGGGRNRVVFCRCASERTASKLRLDTHHTITTCHSFRSSR